MMKNKIKYGEAKIHFGGVELKAGTIESSIENDKEEIKENFGFRNSFSGTLNNVEINGEFLAKLDKARKINNMIKSRKKLEKYID